MNIYFNLCRLISRFANFFRMTSALLLFFAALDFASIVSAEQPSVLFDFSGGSGKVIWSAEPGVSYSLEDSGDLSQWNVVTGFPTNAGGMAMLHQFNPPQRKFFKIEAVDNEPPVVVSQYPPDGGFAIDRFATITVELTDAIGIDPASVRLMAGSIGPLVSGSTGLTITNDTIIYNPGSTPLGSYGETVTNVLIVADSPGNTLTNIWSFRLEPVTQVAANIFVFGSQTAQQTGQQVSGPAASLAGDPPTGTPPPWSIDEVLADSIVITYTPGSAPSFSANTLVCNLVPTRESEVFYRRILSVSDDPGGHLLTLTTEDRDLTDFVIQGAAAFSEDSVVYELDSSGVLVQEFASSEVLDMPRIGWDLSGSSFKLRDDGYETTITNLATYTLGSGPLWLDVSLPEYSWWLTPTVNAALELDASGLKAFEARADGQLDVDTRIDATIQGSGFSVESDIFDLPAANVPRILAYLGDIGVVPVFASLSFDFTLKSVATAKTALTFGATYRQDAEVNFGVTYERADGIGWIHSFRTESPDLSGNANLTGEFSFELTLDPQLELLVYGLAGFDAELKPVSTVEGTSSGAGFDAWVEGDLDFVIHPAGPAMVDLGLDGDELSYNIWHGSWLVPAVSDSLVFKNHPRSRAVPLDSDVSFTCTVDAPSTPSFQWYNNNIPIPKQTSRELLLSRVTEGYAGTYFVRVRAGDETADSDAATLTVYEETSENRDTDGDGIPDIYETGTGVWVSETDRGTDPYKGDTDGDGIGDGAENNTGTFVSNTNTGTNPNKPDTDGDGLGDKKEIDRGDDPFTVFDLPGFEWVAGGVFTMGDQSSTNPVRSGWSDELPAHDVFVSGFHMARYEVIKELWDQVRAWGLLNGYTDLPEGDSKDTSHPVQRISWYDMVKWCNARSERDNITPCYRVEGSVYRTGISKKVACNWAADGYRLPTEAEWEKAARGGQSGKRFPWGDTITHSQANFNNDSGESYASGTTDIHPNWSSGVDPHTSVAGAFAANAYGLRDMAGNVAEWCWDRHSASYYTNSPTVDPRGPDSGEYRVFRGGSWKYGAGRARCAGRLRYWPDYHDYNTLGFRLVRQTATDAPVIPEINPGAVAPSVTLSGPSSATAAYTVSVAFSEAVTGLTASDFTVVNGSASNVSGSGASYTVLITPTGAGNISVTLPADSVTDLNDSLGNTASSTLVTSYGSSSPTVVAVEGSIDFAGFATTDAAVGVTRNVVFDDGNGNSVTIALNLRCSVAGSLITDLSGARFKCTSGLSNERAHFWDSKSGTDENAIFTATFVSSSGSVDATSIEFQINGAVIFGGKGGQTGSEVLWKSDARSSDLDFTYSQWGRKWHTLDDQFHDIDASTYDGIVEFNTTGDRSYYFSDVASGGHTGLDMTVRFEIP